MSVVAIKPGYYVAGRDPVWAGRVEVCDAHMWYWHANWPRRSRSPHYISELSSDHVADGYWIPLVDPDLIVDEGL